jgi:flagellar hook-associated protein 2
MSSVTNSLSSTTAPVTSSRSSSYFNGTSSYSTDLQNIISRSVAIAELPIQLLSNQQTTLKNQSTELTTIDGLVTKLQTAIKSVDQAMSSSSFDASVSDSSLLSATLSSGALEGDYSVEVKDVGAYATSLSAANWTGKSGPYTLWINGASKKVTTTDTSANGIAAAINSQYGDQVHATVVNVGGTGNSDYRVSLQATHLGQTTFDIQNSSGTSLQSVQTSDTMGRQASYSVNGAAAASSNSRSITISNGVTVNLLKASVGTPVDITVTRSTSTLSDALSSFADAYNAVADELAKQHGQSAGPLQGQAILSQIQNTLSKIGTYNSSSNSVNSLAALGLNLGVDGHLTYNPFSLMATDITNSSDVTNFIGSATGGGFLKSAADALNNLEQTGSGLIKSAESSLQTQYTTLGNTIAAKQNQVDQMQANLQQQMSAMDALIASMQQQYSYFSSMFSAQQANTYSQSGL